MQNILSRSETIKYYAIKFGFWGTVLVYVIAAVGMSLISTKNRKKQVEIPAESG